MKRSLSDASSESSYNTAENGITLSPPNGQSRPSTLARGVSPPILTRSSDGKARQKYPGTQNENAVQPKTADVEAGKVDVTDHVGFFSAKLREASLPPSSLPRLQHADWLDLYHRNQTSSGHHFVIHQHDHPIAGTHYDLRLQINATSSMSFAIMYGLPGNPNSRRLNRNATETRVHCLWNHLIETASPQTGTMLIWDTGEYEVLEKATPEKQSYSDTESDTENNVSFQSSFSDLSEPEKLASAFSYRKIRLRLHGTRLPAGYTVYLRLTKLNDRSMQPKAPAFKRQRRDQVAEPAIPVRKASTASTSSESSLSQDSSSSSSDGDISDSSGNTQATRDATHRRLRHSVSSLKRTASPPRRVTLGNSPLKPASLETQQTASTKHEVSGIKANQDKSDVHVPGDEFVSTSTAQDEQERIRRENAYPGAHNSVNSIHQRKWYLSLDRTLSGFHPIPTPKHIDHHAKTYWVPIIDPTTTTPTSTHPPTAQIPANENTITAKQLKLSRNAPGFTPFHVLGREHERSVVTGRLAAQILQDEGVVGYVPRGRWRAVVE